VDLINENRFRPGLGGLRDFEQRLTGLVPGPMKSPRSLNQLKDSVVGDKADRDVERHRGQERWLDDALRDSFPASDPIPVRR